MNYWQNYPKFMVSVLKACYGKAATKENDFGYDWLPKVDGNYSWMYIFDDMYRGNSQRAGGQEPGPEGLITFGMNPVGIGPNSPKMIAAHSKLKWLVVVENHEVETATFWKAPKEYGGPDPSKIQTEVFQLPGVELRREGRLLHELGALDPVEVEGRSIRPDRSRPTRRSWRASSSPCATSTGRKAARFRRRLQRRLELHQSGRARSVRDPEGVERQGARRPPGSRRTRRRC